MSSPSAPFTDRTTTDVFLSYAREDLDLARKLAGSLEARSLTVAMDLTHIGPGENYEERIDVLLRGAARMVFLASATSLASAACRGELEKAQAWGLQILPVLVSDLPGAELPETLRRINYLRLREDDLYETLIDRLATTLRTDLPWERTRADYALQAARGPKVLIRSRSDLREAEAWLLRQPARAQPVAEPIVDLIQRSRARYARQARALALGFGVLAAAFAGIAGLAMQRSTVAEQRQAVLMAAEAERLTEAGRTAEALLVALEAAALAPQDPQVTAAFTLASGNAARQTTYRIPALAYTFEHQNALYFHDSATAELWRIDPATGPVRVGSLPGWLYTSAANDLQGHTGLILHPDRVQIAEFDPLTGKIGRSLVLDVPRTGLARVRLDIGQYGRGLFVARDEAGQDFAIAYDLSSGRTWRLPSADPSKVHLAAFPAGVDALVDRAAHTLALFTAAGPGAALPESGWYYAGAMHCLVQAGVGLRSLFAAGILLDLYEQGNDYMLLNIERPMTCTMAGNDLVMSQVWENGGAVALYVVDLGLHNPPWFMRSGAMHQREVVAYGALAGHSTFAEKESGAAYALGTENSVILPDAIYPMPFSVGQVVMGDGHFLAVEALPWDAADTTRRVVLRRLPDTTEPAQAPAVRLLLEPPCATPDYDGPEPWVATGPLDDPQAFSGIALPSVEENPYGPAILCLFRSGDGQFLALSEGNDIWIRDAATDAQVAALRLETFWTSLLPFGPGFLYARNEREVVTLLPDADGQWRESLVLRLTRRIKDILVDRDQSRIIIGTSGQDGMTTYTAYSTASWTRIALLGDVYWEADFYEQPDGVILAPGLREGVVPAITIDMAEDALLQALGADCMPADAREWRSSPCWPVGL